MKLLWKKGVVIACALSVSACASIVGGRYQKVEVETRAANQSVHADCTLSNGESQVRVTTPGTATVHRSSHDLSVSCQKDGKQIAQQSYDSTIRGMVWGNLIFGGLIGIVVDFSDGASHHYPDKLSVPVSSSYASGTVYSNAGIARTGAMTAPAPTLADGLASMDSRVGKTMFNAAQNVAAAHQCNRAIHVVMVDGQRAMFRSQCPASDDVQIECAGDACVAMQPTGLAGS
ncbi:hypothetical protein [Dyella telluris]|uniref:Lipoprotein n=1 Tax=Dyella telluris TaxID=2763498 RepID=A0A7G8PZI0_9GAMM|nr:hypothetical protein [Dyella telluris]QNJ99937.1 hypothetical protein H8F01_12400 [Dyella telluris]